MTVHKLFYFVFIILTALSACTDEASKQESAVFKQIPEIQEVKIEKPVKVKLKRNGKEDYSWEIQGDVVEEIVAADKKLRMGLKAK